MKSKKLLMCIIAFALLLCTTFALSACGDSGDSPATITVTFVADEKKVLSKTITLGSELNKDELPAVPDKTGYVGEWETYELNYNDITINAKYTAKTYTLTFDYDGADGNNTQKTKTVTYNQPIGELPAPTKTGVRFVKWSIGTRNLTSSTVWNIDSDSIITAVWGEYYSEGLNFTLNSERTGYSVSKGTCTDTNVVIPTNYNGLPVTSIESYAFYNCTNITSVTIGDAIEGIGYNAFAYCNGITSVTIGNGVTNIETEAFKYCYNLRHSAPYPQSF